MKLYEYKAKSLAELLNYSAKNEKEQQYISLLVTKINSLRSINLPSLMSLIYNILNDRNISNEFTDLLRKLIPDPNEVDELLKQ